jgi:hypothetical protein
MNKRRNLQLRNAFFHHRHLLISWWCRRAQPGFILLHIFLYSSSSTSDTFQPSSFPVYRSHSLLMLVIFWFVFSATSVLICFLSNFEICYCNSDELSISWLTCLSIIGHAIVLCLRNSTSAMKVLKVMLTLPHQNDRLDSPNWFYPTLVYKCWYSTLALYKDGNM